MADEKELTNLTSGLKFLTRKDTWLAMCRAIGIEPTDKDSVAAMRRRIMSSIGDDQKRPAETSEGGSSKKKKGELLADAVAKMQAKVIVPVKLADDKKGEEAEPMATYTRCESALINREALCDQIHKIHNYLRNRGVGYGMMGLKVFNLFYGLARVEQYGLFDIIGLDPECKFSKLVEIARRMEAGDRSDGTDAINKLTLDYQKQLHAIKMARKFILAAIPDNMNGSTIAQLVLDIDFLFRSEAQIGEQICGKVYEYFVGRDKSAISELGAYFTNRSITQFIYAELAPTLDADGKVQSMIDPFGGSGGFTTGYVMEMNKRHENIDWNDGLSRIFHFDMNSDVVRYAALELMCLTKALPDMCENMACENSFASEKFRQCKYVCTNPPYGGDSTDESASQMKRKLLKDHIAANLATLRKKPAEFADKIKLREAQLAQIERELRADDIEADKHKVKTDSPLTSQFIKNYARENELFASDSRAGREVLFGNDKEATSLILIAALVAPGGTGVGVLKEGVFFNGKYALLRKHLIEKFNVRKVVSVPSDQFENTSTKTSIIFFDNDPAAKTTSVQFTELNVETYKDDEFGEDAAGNLAVIGAKGEFQKVIELPVSSASLEELQKVVGKKQPYSLDGKQYIARPIVPGPGYKMEKLGDLCTFREKSQRAASFGKSEGKYPFFTSSSVVKRCDVADYEHESVIIGNGGMANVALASNFSCSDCNFILASAIVPTRYIYYILLGRIELLQSGFHGSTLKHISKAFVTDLKIPVPDDSARLGKWVEDISKAYDERGASDGQMAIFKKMIADLAREAIPPADQ